MTRWLGIAALALLIVALPASAAGVSGKYVEARTCDVWVAACFANSEMISGKHAVLGWKVDKGTIDNIKLDGLSVVAIVAASDTLGLEQTGPAKAMLIIDSQANAAQRRALIKLAKKQGGDLVKNVIAVESADIDLTICKCEGNACARLKAGDAKIETRCLDAKHDKVCGGERAFYPPLAKGVTAKAAMATENSFTGKGLKETWKEADRRGAYVGSFEVK
jgi:hypothetical protein